MQKVQSNTMGYGNCFFHALLGEKNSNGQFEDIEHLLHRTQLITYAQDKLGKIIDNYENETDDNINILNAFATRFRYNIDNILLDTFDKKALKKRINQKIQNEFGNNGQWIEIGLFNSFASDCFKKNFIILIPDAEHAVEGSYGSGDTTIINFVNGNHFERVEQEQYISNPDDKNSTLQASPINQRPLLIDLAFRGNHDALKDMGNYDPNVTDTIFKDNTPLIWAIANENNEFASKFIETFGDKIDFLKQALDNNALFLMLTKGYTDKNSGGATFDEQYSALNIAKKIKETIGNERFKELINQKCRLGNTALHIACARHDTETIIFLIESGADIESQNEHGLTPFDMLDLKHKDACDLCNNISSAFLLDKTLYDSFDKKNIKVSQEQNTSSKPAINIIAPKNRDIKKTLLSFSYDVRKLNKDRDVKIREATKQKTEIKHAPTNTGSINNKGKYQILQHKTSNSTYIPVYARVNMSPRNIQHSVVSSSVNTQTNNRSEDDKKTCKSGKFIHRSIKIVKR